MNQNIFCFSCTSIFLCAVFAITSLGCSKPEPTGPPEIRLGRDECSGCKMSIVDRRCVGALLASDANGLQLFLFDDIHCMMNFQKNRTDLRITQIFAQDYRENQWLAMDKAILLKSATAHTAMGSGIIALNNQTHAQEAASEFGGQVLTWNALLALESSKP